MSSSLYDYFYSLLQRVVWQSNRVFVQVSICFAGVRSSVAFLTSAARL